MDNTNVAPKKPIDQAFDELMKISECTKEEMVEHKCRDDQAEYMLNKIMRYGSYQDAAHAIRHYFEYMFHKHMPTA